MTKWQPTNELRFVLRDTYSIEYGDVCEQVLQQKWERYESEWYEGKPETEWRDVPVESE